jgi:hypothetical protein
MPRQMRLADTRKNNLHYEARTTTLTTKPMWSTSNPSREHTDLQAREQLHEVQVTA